MAQISVVTQHYDIGRTGANTNETILTPTNVNAQEFGRLFSQTVDGYVYAQPLYVPGVVMGTGTPQSGTTHNVVFVATENDSVYAFDADTNSTAATAVPLWHITLLDAPHGAAMGARPMYATDLPGEEDIVPVVGISSTPVIDLSSGTIYVVGKTKENGTYVQRLHALSIANGAEKFGGPVQIQAAVPGNGKGSVSGILHFDALHENQRAGLLLLHGIVYIAFGAHNDIDPYHGWILAYNAATLHQTGAWCATRNGTRGGMWGGGSGLAANVPDPTGHPYGRLFVSTGNGTFDASAPSYSDGMDYGNSVFKLDLNNGTPTMRSGSTVVGDIFTPYNQSQLDVSDLDQGSGGVLLLPNSDTGGQHLLVQVGKSGKVYVLNQENLGGYHPTNAIDTQQKTLVREIFGKPAYWNGHLYLWPMQDHLRAFPLVNGVLSSAASSISAEYSNFPGSTPVVSASGKANGIVWNVISDQFAARGGESLQAHDATNVSKLLYDTRLNQTRDNPGPAVKFVVPTVANGKVYVGSETQLSVYGLLNGATQAAAPVISPASESFNSPISVTISDSTAGASLHFTTDGTTPTAASAMYSGPITVTKSQTVQAVALASGHLASPISSAKYNLVTQATMPTFTPAPGTYSSTQVVTLKTSTPNATMYYTLDGSTPTTSSTKYTTAITISSTHTLKAIATAAGLTNSAVASAAYTIQSGTGSAAAPKFTPAPGSYTGYAQITMTTPTSGASIYYTTNGADPNAVGALYRGYIIVHTTATVKAIAKAPGMNNSSITSGLYTIH